MKKMKKIERKKLQTRYDIDIDSNDVESLRQFFKDHYDYKSSELCHKYGIPIPTLNYWRRKAGLSNERPKMFSENQRKPIKVKCIDDPKVWDNGPWFEEMYVNRKMGAYIIAKIIKRSAQTVYNKLEKYEIPLRTHKDAVATKNEYCNKEWLLENYVEQNKSLANIAIEANVNPYTIYNWLSHFEIPIRDYAASTVIRCRLAKFKAYHEKHGTIFSKAERRTIKESSSKKS